MAGYGTTDTAMVETVTLARTCASVGWTMPRLAPDDPIHSQPYGPRGDVGRARSWAITAGRIGCQRNVNG